MQPQCRRVPHFCSPIGRAFTIESVSEMATPILEKRGMDLYTFFNVEIIDPERKVVQSLTLLTVESHQRAASRLPGIHAAVEVPDVRVPRSRSVWAAWALCTPLRQ